MRQPSAGISSTTCASPRSSLMNSLPCSVRSQQVRAARLRRSRACSPPWVWAALAPVTKRRLTIDVGARTLAMAQCAGPQGAQVLAPDGMPLVLTEGDQESVTALLSHCGQWVQPPRRQANGPTPTPRGLPLPQWL